MLLILIFFFLDTGETCQPPMPAVGYQHNPVPMTANVPSQYSPPNSIAGSPLDQSAPIPPPPPPPALEDNEMGDQLEMINAPHRNIKAANTISVTPFPGFVPPPSSSSDSSFPTLIENSELPQLQNHVNQQSSNTFRSETPLQILMSENKKDYSCPQEMTSLPDFLNCVRRLSVVTLDENNMNCDFEKDSGCRFKSITSPLSVGNFPTADHYRTFATLASRPEEKRPSGNFVFFIEHRGTEPEDEFIMSTPIVCQKGNGVLKFDYWIAGKHDDVNLRVCTQNHLARSCTQSIIYNPASSTIAIEVVHPNSTFFELEIVVSNLVEPTVIVYDNIEYKAELCEEDQKKEEGEEDVTETSLGSVDSFFDSDDAIMTTDGETESDTETVTAESETIPLTIPTRPIRLSPVKKESPSFIEKDEDIIREVSENAEIEEENESPPSTLCKLLDCDFSEDMCMFSNYVNDSMTLAPWQVGAQRIGNPHTGVRDGRGGFAYVGTDNPGTSKIVNYIMESPDLSVDEDFQISLDIYRRSNDISLQVCLDTPFYCPYHVSPFEKDEYWKEEERVLIPKGTLKIYLKAIQWRKFKWLAIDNFRVISEKC